MAADRCQQPGPAPGLRLATRAVHAGASPDAGTGARVTPIFHTNGFVFEDQQHGAELFALERAGFAYSRGANPTTAVLERRVADLEGGTAAIGVASGQAALLLIILTLCESGDEIIAAREVFGGSRALMKRLEKRYGITTHLVDVDDTNAIASATGPRTKAIFIESIANPTGAVIDIPAIAAIARTNRIPLVVDNTLATPALMRPGEFGADIVWHSASKFFVGNGTAIGGVIVDCGSFDWAGDTRFPLMSEPWLDYNGLVIAERFPQTAFATACRLLGLRELGPGISPTNAFLILTGIETLSLRMQRHVENARAVAGYLRSHPAVTSVTYPDLPGQPGCATARQFCPNGAGSIFLVTLEGGLDAARAALSRLKLFSHLVNIGETRSLVAHPASTTHRQLSPDERRQYGIGEGTLRLSVGIESVEDLIVDLEQALSSA